MIAGRLSMKEAKKPTQTIEMDMKRARYAAMKWYRDKLLMNHFLPGNDIIYEYKPLNDKYLAWKQKYYPPGTQMLVLTGKLRDAIKYNTKVDRKTGDLIFDYPEYGDYVKEIRDFIMPNESDAILIQKKFDEELKRIRKGRAANRFRD